jgi:type I restriction enzyme S subunit
MELREGYKQTEVGVIPENWEVKSYDESFSFLSTATYSRSQLSEHETVQYLHYGDIHTKYDHHLDFSIHKLPSVSDELAKKKIF